MFYNRIYKKIRPALAIVAVSLMVFICGCASSGKNLKSAGKIIPYSIDSAELKSNRYTSIEPEPLDFVNLSLEGFEPVLENENYICYYKSSVCGIRFVDKSNGYIWGSLANEKPENLNKKWTNFANSVVAINVADEGDSVSVVGAVKEDISYSVKGDVIKFKADFKEHGISFEFDFTLTSDGFKIEVDKDSVKEGKDKRLVDVVFLPYFGSVLGAEKQGYMFVPDGCGALIRFNEPRNYLEGYSKRIYGIDYGIDSLSTISDMGADRINVFETNEQSVSMPVFGMSHGTEQNAYYAIVESGAEYCKINADPAGIITDYNRINASFIYRGTYEQPVNRKSAGVKTVQKQRNDISPTISYHFLSGEDADYVGMAKGYRDYLTENKMLNSRCDISADAIPLRLDILVSDVQKEFIGNSVNKITGYHDIKNLIEFLQKSDAEKINLSLLGWQKSGLNGYKILKKSVNSQYSESQIKDLHNMLGKNDGNLLLSVAAFKGSKLQFDTKSQSAITMSQNIAKISAEDDSFYLADEYLIKPDIAVEKIEEQIKKSKYDIVLSDMGNMLYGEYLENNVTSRAQSLKLITDMFESLNNDGFAFSCPNSYLYKYTKLFYNAPIVSSQYVFESDCVPFLQIVISGSMEMYSPYINCNLYSKVDLLRLIDYNVYPSFVLSGKGNYEFRNTASSVIQSSKITDWQDYIKDSYQMINEVLLNTYGKQILNRTVLSNGFVKIDYSGGSVFVNYNDTDMQYGDISVLPQKAIYVSGGG